MFCLSVRSEEQTGGGPGLHSVCVHACALTKITARCIIKGHSVSRLTIVQPDVGGGQSQDTGLVQFLGREADDGHQRGQLVDEEVEFVAPHLLRHVPHVAV